MRLYEDELAFYLKTRAIRSDVGVRGRALTQISIFKRLVPAYFGQNLVAGWSWRRGLRVDVFGL